MSAAASTGSVYDTHGAIVVGNYRYELWRGWGEKRVLFVMLNPSTADARIDDPTIRKCVGFATRWGYHAVDVVNLFAWRASKPGELRDVSAYEGQDIVGPDNNTHIRARAYGAERIVLAWGSHAELRKHISPRAIVVRELIHSMRAGRSSPGIGRLGERCKDGEPRHPLMLSYATPFIEGT